MVDLFSLHLNLHLIFGFVEQTATIGLNFFASLAISGIMNMLYEAPPYRKHRWGYYAAYFVAAGTIAFFFVYVAYKGQPSNSIVRSHLVLVAVFLSVSF